jgi:hypothetical protein
LTNSGDFDIKKEEWKALPPPVEDVCKLNFSFARELNYQHPRTTMLMFGPKNAPTKQTHYLYVPFESNNGNSDFTIENIAKSKITKFAILFITQFDGVPMADVFKVLQYQFYENIGDNNKCSVRIGLQMHYIKSSMFKGQIMSGTKEELGSQIASWLDYVKKKSSTGGPARAIAAGDGAGGSGEGAVSGNASATGAGSVASGAVYTGSVNASQQDLTQQILAAMMNNIPALVLLVFALLFFFMHIWYTRSKIVYLTSKVRSLENFQKKVLVDLINKVAANSTCKNA